MRKILLFAILISSCGPTNKMMNEARSQRLNGSLPVEQETQKIKDYFWSAAYPSATGDCNAFALKKANELSKRFSLTLIDVSGSRHLPSGCHVQFSYRSDAEIVQYSTPDEGLFSFGKMETCQENVEKNNVIFVEQTELEIETSYCYEASRNDFRHVVIGFGSPSKKFFHADVSIPGPYPPESIAHAVVEHLTNHLQKNGVHTFWFLDQSSVTYASASSVDFPALELKKLEYVSVAECETDIPEFFRIFGELAGAPVEQAVCAETWGRGFAWIMIKPATGSRYFQMTEQRVRFNTTAECRAYIEEYKRTVAGEAYKYALCGSLDILHDPAPGETHRVKIVVPEFL